MLLLIPTPWTGRSALLVVTIVMKMHCLLWTSFFPSFFVLLSYVTKEENDPFLSMHFVHHLVDLSVPLAGFNREWSIWTASPISVPVTQGSTINSWIRCASLCTVVYNLLHQFYALWVVLKNWWAATGHRHCSLVSAVVCQLYVQHAVIWHSYLLLCTCIIFHFLYCFCPFLFILFSNLVLMNRWNGPRYRCVLA